MIELFQTTKQNISLHIDNIFKEGELEKSVVKYYLTTATDGKSYNVIHYALDMVISVGYRVHSKEAIRFRQWATRILRDYVVKGFAIDDTRLQADSGRYGSELYQRIAAIRSSEANAYRQLLDVFVATSSDYDRKSPQSRLFFATAQNRLHYAVTGLTAAELIHSRVDGTRDDLGLTNYTGTSPTRRDVIKAKCYLTIEELQVLQQLTSIYLGYASIQASLGRTITMATWLQKLDAFIEATDLAILASNGSISRRQAYAKALAVYHHSKET
jgi:hypothetical protein